MPPGRQHDPEPARLGSVSERLARTLLAVGIDGAGRFESAEELARRVLAAASSPEDSVSAIVALHTRLVAAGGFATGVGGLLTMPLALPANVVSFSVLATRMVAAIASVRGYDVRRDEVRTAVLLTLVGPESSDVVRALGVVGQPGRLSSAALSRLTGPTLMLVNKAVGFRLLVRLGHRGFARFGRAMPLAGGVVGAGLDAVLLRGIAREANRAFPPRPDRVLAPA